MTADERVIYNQGYKKAMKLVLRILTKFSLVEVVEIILRQCREKKIELKGLNGDD